MRFSQFHQYFTTPRALPKFFSREELPSPLGNIELENIILEAQLIFTERFF